MDIAIVGGGASGLLVAIHLLRDGPRGLRITLIEKTPRLGAGVAYSTPRPEHLLNVTAGRMSAFEDDPDHFVRYLRAQSPQSDPTLSSIFAQRRQFAAYLRATLDEARAASAAGIEIVHDEVVAIDGGDPLRLTCRSGRIVDAQRAVLALGNWPRTGLRVPAVLQARVAAGWDYAAIAEIGADETVVVAGSGLSMVDAVLTLAGNGHRAPIHVVSRHGLLPLPHAVHGHLDVDIDALAAMPLRQRLRQLRRQARAAAAAGRPWQWLMDSLRGDIVRLWQTLSPADQRRFLRHAARYWDVHRHRIPPSAAAMLDALRASGQLRQHHGRIADIAHGNGRPDVRIARHGGAAAETLAANRLIDCTGLQGDIRRVPDALVESMLANGRMRPGAHGIGIDTDSTGAVIAGDGHADARLLALGSVRIGQLWESVAVPELRVQSAAIARNLLADSMRH